MEKLVIISHTEHHILDNGQVVGWGPTIEEVNYLSQFWEQVVHVGCLEKGVPNPSSLPYISTNTRYQPIPTFGGQHWIKKLDILWKSPQILMVVMKAIKGATHIQIRVPMGIGVVILPLFLFRKKNKAILWVKYANNWEHVSTSMGYRFQKWILKKNLLKCPVTINGFWPNQPRHCKSFENPCIGDLEEKQGEKAREKKVFQAPYSFAFVGRVDEHKGIDLFIQTVSHIPAGLISHFHIVGDGKLNLELQQKLAEHNIPFTAHGFLPKKEVFQVLEHTHFLLLPSKSEGFPKVIAEALCMGCLPIATKVGSISHYIQHQQNGFLMEDVSSDALLKSVLLVSNTPGDQLKIMAKKGGEGLTKKFTFKHYYEKLITEVFHVF